MFTTKRSLRIMNLVVVFREKRIGVVEIVIIGGETPQKKQNRRRRH